MLTLIDVQGALYLEGTLSEFTGIVTAASGVGLTELILRIGLHTDTEAQIAAEVRRSDWITRRANPESIDVENHSPGGPLDPVKVRVLPDEVTAVRLLLASDNKHLPLGSKQVASKLPRPRRQRRRGKR